jgi:hypothetical protein
MSARNRASPIISGGAESGLVWSRELQDGERYVMAHQFQSHCGDGLPKPDAEDLWQKHAITAIWVGIIILIVATFVLVLLNSHGAFQPSDQITPHGYSIDSTIPNR